jgi:hypothetical protein
MKLNPQPPAISDTHDPEQDDEPPADLGAHQSARRILNDRSCSMNSRKGSPGWENSAWVWRSGRQDPAANHRCHFMFLWRTREEGEVRWLCRTCGILFARGTLHEPL